MKFKSVYFLAGVAYCVLCVVVTVDSKNDKEFRGGKGQGSGSRGKGRPTDPPDLEEVENSAEGDPGESQQSEEVNGRRVGEVTAKIYPSQLGEEVEAMLMNGIELDFGYNETEDESGRIISTPGCPESVKNILDNQYDPWVYFGSPPRCFLSGSRGPCPEGMTLGIRRGSKYGKCQCSCFSFQSFGYDGKDVWNPFLNDVQKHCYDAKEDRNFVYYPPENKCYALLTQGPCNSTEWLILGKKNRPKCKKRTCPAEKADPTLSNSTYPQVVRYFFQEDTNSCVKFMEGCGDRMEYILGRSNWIPECGPSRSRRPTERFFGSEILPSDCERYGQLYSSYLNRCITVSSTTGRVG